MRFGSKAKQTLVAVVSLSLTAAALAGRPGQVQPRIEWVPGEVIVGFHDVPTTGQMQIIEVVAADAASAWRSMPHAPHYKDRPNVVHPLAKVRVLEVAEDADIPALADVIAQLPGVRYAEPNYRAHTAHVPNDPDYHTEQYGPQIIEAEEAWDTTLGSSSIVLAVADTGFNYNHEDLADGLYVNPDETLNGIDDDGNGFIDDINGWDFYFNDNDMTDGNGHGSHVSGIAAARIDNNRGMAGMAQVRIMPLQVFSAGGSGTWEAIANAIFYATDNDVNVLNYSGGGFGGSSLLADAVEYAWDGGMPVVAAAGNFNSSSPFYPAAYPDCLAISGTDRFDNRYSSSNHGAWIDVAAPGVDVYSCYWNGTSSYVNLTGTSMSSPHAAGLVALMLSVDPDLTPQNVRDLLRDNAVDLGAVGFDNFFGYGRIDAAATLAAIDPVTFPEDYEFVRGQVLEGDLEDLFNSDDAHMIVQPGITLDQSEAPVWMIVTTTADVDDPSALRFVLEAGSNVAGLEQRVELFNYDTGEFELVDLGNATIGDSVVEVVIDTDAGRFIDDATLESQAQIRWRANGPVVAQWSIQIDRTVWDTE